MKAPCFMCKKRPPKKLTAHRDGNEYINAVNVTLFCSLRCAANYGLLWGAPEIEANHHFCSATNEWELIGQQECLECREEDVS